MIQVFGGSGFVGSEFVQQNDKIILNSREDFNVSPNTKEIVYFISTVTNYNVFNDPYIDIETNLITLIKIIEQCQNKNLVFNFISSWFVYGDTEVPAKETSYCMPNGFYSITKRCAEQLLISYCRTFNIKYRILRLANVVGRGDKKASTQKNALQYMINQLKKGLDINIYNNGKIYRDYIHVFDVAVCIRLIIEKGKINEIYNVGNGVPVLFKEIIEYAKKLIGGDGKLISIEVPQFHKIVQVESMWMDNTKLKELGYTPRYDVKSMVQDMVSE